MKEPADAQLQALRRSIDDYASIFRKRSGASTLAGYLAVRLDEGDEETLTEPILRGIIENVLGFPKGAYLEQLRRSGRKPDFTPEDVIAHSFVLDAKSTRENLSAHEQQIRGYMDQRRLNYGVVFNLRELQVFRRGKRGPVRELSFPVLPLWELARGEALPGDEVRRFEGFCKQFGYQEVSPEARIRFVADQPSWAARFRSRESLEIDVEALVERLHRLAVRLADDAGGQVEALDDYVGFDDARESRLLEELQLLALDVAPGTNPDTLPTSLAGWRDGDDLAGAVWRQYLTRVAYLALTRILLYRAWEDVGFVDSYLYDGGFEREYERLHHDVQSVLGEAFLHGQERYHWLFGRENNYDWYHPSSGPLVDVLYSLAPEPLGKLDADVLGSLYATYVEEIDRDRLGQFFTPREVVRFMLDRAGFEGPNVFRIEGDTRKPLRVLDFATGSGGFLVEAASRVIEAVGGESASPRDLRDALGAIVAGFVGGEISPFPYYLTEINLLLQVSRLLGPLRAHEHRPLQSFGALGVLPVDTLTAKSAPDRSLELDPELRADHAELVADERFGLVPLDGDKRRIYSERLRPDGGFDLVVGNPPYVAEAGNKALFARLRAIPAWRGIYRGKTDYLYYFLLLAIEKVKPGGKLCVITPAGWMNAGTADFLRERMTAELTLEELYLFGSYRLFATEDAAPTPTVESAILVATRAPAPKRHKLRVVALEDEAAAPQDRHDLLEEMARRADGRAGRAKGIHVHSIEQASLRADRPWSVKHRGEDLASVVVAHLEAQLDRGAVEPLRVSWKVFLGIQTGADAYSRKIRSRLPAHVRAAVEAEGGRLGDAIYGLPPGTETAQPWVKQPEALVKSPEPEAILYGAVDSENYVNLVWLTPTNPPSEPVLVELARWRPLLAARAEFLNGVPAVACRWWSRVATTIQWHTSAESSIANSSTSGTAYADACPATSGVTTSRNQWARCPTGRRPVIRVPRRRPDSCVSSPRTGVRSSHTGRPFQGWTRSSRTFGGSGRSVRRRRRSYASSRRRTPCRCGSIRHSSWTSKGHRAPECSVSRAIGSSSGAGDRSPARFEATRGGWISWTRSSAGKPTKH